MLWPQDVPPIGLKAACVQGRDKRPLLVCPCVCEPFMHPTSLSGAAQCASRDGTDGYLYTCTHPSQQLECPLGLQHAAFPSPGRRLCVRLCAQACTSIDCLFLSSTPRDVFMSVCVCTPVHRFMCV